MELVLNNFEALDQNEMMAIDGGNAADYLLGVCCGAAAVCVVALIILL